MSTSTLLLLLSLWISASGKDNGEECYFEDKEAFCTSAGQNLTIQVIINDCVRPVDVNFHITHGTNWTWSHSFVNYDETQHVASAPTDEYLSLHIVVTHLEPTLLHIQANLVIDGVPAALFLNDTTPIQHSHECKPANGNELLPLVLLVVLLSMSGGLLVWVVVWRRRRALCLRHTPHGQELLLDTDRPATSYSHDDTAQHGTKPGGSTTPIRSPIYSDPACAVPEYLQDPPLAPPPPPPSRPQRAAKYRSVATAEPPYRDGAAGAEAGTGTTGRRHREDIPMEEFTIHGDETDVIVT